VSRGNATHFGDRRGIVLAMPRALAVSLRGLLGADHHGSVDPTFAPLVEQLDRQLAPPPPPPSLADLLARATTGDTAAAKELLVRIAADGSPRKRGGR
jgi:hypothetical protein